MNDSSYLVYLDQGVLVYLSKDYDQAKRWLGIFKKTIKKIKNDAVVKFAYSEANFWDLKNADYYERELKFLNDFEAEFICQVEGEAILTKNINPNSEFVKCDRIAPVVLGGIFSLIIGGGEDASLQSRVKETLERAKISHFDDIKDFVAPSLEKLEGNGDIKKLDFSNAFQAMRKIKDRENLKQFIDRLDEAARDQFMEVFPAQAPSNLHQLAMASLMLNWILEKPSKGIRGVKRKHSENEVSDAYHIAAALHCGLFFTTDKSTAKKFAILAEYWNVGNRALIFEKE